MYPKNVTSEIEPEKSMNLMLKSWIKRHSALTYFVMTITISWSLVICLVGINGIVGTTQEQNELLYPFVFTLFVGPVFSSLTLIIFLYGKDGLYEYASRLTKWNVGIHWYILAFLLAPVIGFGTLFLLVPLSGVYLPAIVIVDDKLALLIMGLVIGISAGIFEETGWTGFAIPELRKKYGVFTTGIIVGFVWGVWHYISAIWASGNDNGVFTFSLFLPMMVFYIVALPIFRIIMVWVYDNTKSLLIAIIMHGSLTGNVLFLLLSPELSADKAALTIWYFVFAIPLYIIVACLIVYKKRILISKQAIDVAINI